MAGGIADARDSIMRFGKAEPGDKTLVDVLVPFSAALTDAVDRGVGLVEAWGRALVVADAAAEATASLRPKIGRARPLAEKSLGSPDPGAVSMAMIIRAVHEVLSSKGNQS